MNDSVGGYSRGHGCLFLSFSSSVASCLERGPGRGMLRFLFGPSDCPHSQSHQCCLHMVLVMFWGKNVGGKPYILHFKFVCLFVAFLAFTIGVCVCVNISLYETVHNSTSSYKHYLVLRNHSFNCRGNSYLCFWKALLVRCH